jgi:pimeloyl-ACP methyl ester carboxylesterase
LLLTGLVYLAPRAVTIFALKPERKRSGLVRKEITLTNGLHYVYLEGGHGETLVLLHGFGGNKDTFTRVARYLTNDYRVIIPDIIGFGESLKPTKVDYSPPAQVERLRVLFQALGIAKLYLGGNSMGGQIAII